jgi:hypothetical protein
LIFYTKIYQEQLPKDINKFLFYCLIVGRWILIINEIHF